MNLNMRGRNKRARLKWPIKERKSKAHAEGKAKSNPYELSHEDHHCYHSGISPSLKPTAISTPYDALPKICTPLSTKKECP